ncbi:MAG TPA: Uma2 family endonuclease [Blastocatellia bacterium]|nr:Uma2 family endonuclease [Blastocatellia bacterium]
MAVSAQEATIEDLYQIKQKAEIVNGEIVLMPPTGDAPGYAGDEIFVSLRQHARQTGTGRAVGDNKGFHVRLPHRKSFSPDAAFIIAQSMGMKFFEGAPQFAVEVRSENDYGRKAEREMADKRDDYFAAGTLVVWDVDLLSDDVIKSYRADDPDNPIIFRRGEIAHAEPAVPGWSMPVNDLFPPENN